ncbi:MAG: class IV adenylate cyclase [Planctomycetia bacterium]|nr:class IV adenylate cyclase [Planctomycetia bacterium]
MKLEVEQKFRVVDPAALRARLEGLGVAFATPFRQVDAYFNHPARDFAATDEALRIRTVGEENFVTYKGPKLDKTVKTRRELEQPLVGGSEAAARFEELLLALGFRATAKVVKRRSAAELQRNGTQFEIVWDEVDEVGTFLEIELVVDSHEIELAKGKILALQDELGLQEVERRSYLEMLLEKSR